MAEERSAIVVGVDGTEASRVALEFAIREGMARGSAVEVVTAWSWEGAHEPLNGPATATEARHRAEQIQEEVVALVLRTVPNPPMLSRQVVGGEAGRVLLHAARGAAYLVVGSAHRGIVARAVLGSVSQYCVRHATCPVVVVPALLREQISAPLVDEGSTYAAEHESIV